MMSTAFLYWRTIRNLKPVQIYTRVKKTLGLGCFLGVQPSPMPKQIRVFESVKELDYDPNFLSRFPADEFIAGKVSFLHKTEQFDWQSDWNASNRSALWNFNLHYFEFLMSLVHAYERSYDHFYLKAIENIITSWIEKNGQQAGGPGWAPYTIAIRLTYWLAAYFALADSLDTLFRDRMLASMYDQYVYLGKHLEKDLMANHYFEDLKAVLLGAIAFQDEKMLERATVEFKKQCREQILPDGMHFELSPMYHKIILESLIRVAVALRSVGRPDEEIEAYLQKMIDVVYTFEEGLERTPLFNDSGNNIAKSHEALLLAVKNHYGLTPCLKDHLPDSGYYFFRRKGWKMIVDAGGPGPKCNLGHAHCDAMSFELFHHGKPLLVNCGTYAYQSADRSFFRSTAAHNTVSLDGIDQSEAWAEFRMGKTSRTQVLDFSDKGICMAMTDQDGKRVERDIYFENDKLVIKDHAPGHKLQTVLHIKAFPMDKITASSDGHLSCQHEKHWYAEDFGKRESIDAFVWKVQDQITIDIDLDMQDE